LVPVQNNSNSLLPNNPTPPPYQELVPTIKDLPINENNNIPAERVSVDSYKKEITYLIGYLTGKQGYKFPNYGKQAKYTKSMLVSGYSIADITWAIDKMLNDSWWSIQSFDMKNVADEIPKLMTRTYKNGGNK
jgi:hypothetical protein